MANLKFKEFWSDTPAQVSGCIVIFILVGLVGMVLWSGLNEPHQVVRLIFAAAIGYHFAYRVFTTGVFILDFKRTVTGRVAKALGIVALLLGVEATSFVLLELYRKFLLH